MASAPAAEAPQALQLVIHFDKVWKSIRIAVKGEDAVSGAKLSTLVKKLFAESSTLQRAAHLQFFSCFPFDGDEVEWLFSLRSKAVRDALWEGAKVSGWVVARPAKQMSR